MSLVRKISVSNYKSIASAELNTRRVNVFVGGPNTGKSNVLESLGLLSIGVQRFVREVTRAHEAADLFFDHEISAPIDVRINDSAGWKLEFNSSNGQFFYRVTDPRTLKIEGGTMLANLGPHSSWAHNVGSVFRYYQFPFQRRVTAPSQYGSLQPPYGENLPAVLYSDKTFRESVSALFRSMDFRLEVRPQTSEILISKDVNGILYSYRFEAISETLQRIVFYKAAFETNRNAVLILDEPETNTFPFYTKYLAERIALDTHNQFFLTTHNPYVLTALIEKTAKEDIAVFVTRMRNYRTEFHLASDKQLSEMLDLTMDVFLNLDQFFSEE
jgi:AAA15 family ATPase/GTPase